MSQARATHLLLTAALLAQACVVIAPLEDVRATELLTTRSETRADAAGSGGTGGLATAAGGGGRAVAAGGGGAAAAADDDAGPSCEPFALTPCNPVMSCGCEAGELCALADDASAIACVAGSGGSKARGESCKQTSDCMAGLQCPVTHICSPYCARDADCGVGERCIPFEHEVSHQTVTGSGSCQTVCDPVSGSPCPSGTRCLPSLEARTFKWAVCQSTEAVTLSPLGASCDDDSVVCEPKLACSRYGQELCLPACRTDSDCPSTLPRCYVVDRLAAPGERIGDCWYDPCDDNTIPAAPPWTAGPVATAAQLTECQNTCGPKLTVDLTCVQERCVQDLARCITQAREACVAAKQGPCRAEYVAASCVDWRTRIGKHRAYEDCVETKQDCALQAQQVCAQ